MQEPEVQDAQGNVLYRPAGTPTPPRSPRLGLFPRLLFGVGVAAIVFLGFGLLIALLAFVVVATGFALLKRALSTRPR